MRMRFSTLLGLGFLALGLLCAACETGSEEDYAVSSLSRPTAVAIALLDWEPTSSEIAIAESEEEGAYGRCLGLPKRPFAFISNTETDTVARIDLCSGEILRATPGGNPFVISHIPVGAMPGSLAVSLDNRLLVVANTGESALSLVDPVTAQPYPYKVDLPSHPATVAVSPYLGSDPEAHPEGDFWVTLPMLRQVARVRKATHSEPARFAYDGAADLATADSPNPVPGGIAVDPGGERLYIADMNSEYLLVLNLLDPGAPPQTKRVYAPQRAVSVSPDGRFLYLSKLDQRRIAVWDLKEDRYVDAQSYLPSHAGNPPPSDLTSYDIDLHSFPRKVVFARTPKALSDGDEETESAAETETEPEAETETDAEAGPDGDGTESDGLAVEDVADAPEEETSEEETEEGEGGDSSAGGAELFAYAVTFDGQIQVIDAHSQLHRIYDTNPYDAAQLALLDEEELEVDNTRCLSTISHRVSSPATPDGLWELSYNGVLPGSDASAAGRFEVVPGSGACPSEIRFYDDTMDFFALRIEPRPETAREEDFSPRLGDRLVVKTSPLKRGGERPGCTEETLDDQGNPVLVALDQVSFEILGIGEEEIEENGETRQRGYLRLDPRCVDLGACFNTPVEYDLRTNGNYYVELTYLDLNGKAISSPGYEGRAYNVEFRPGDTVSGQEQFEQLRFENSDYNDYVCIVETPQSSGPALLQYHFRTDLKLSGSGQTMKGIHCLNPWDDGNEYGLSFRNDRIAFALCQDPKAQEIIAKQSSTFTYAFRTYSGVSEILPSSSSDEESASVYEPIGTLLEDADYFPSPLHTPLLDDASAKVYPANPRLYLVDSAEESVWVIDLTNDVVVWDIY